MHKQAKPLPDTSSGGYSAEPRGASNTGSTGSPLPSGLSEKPFLERLLDFVEHPFVTMAVSTIGGVVGTFLFKPVFLVCAISVVLAFHRAGVVRGKNRPVQFLAYFALLVTLAVGILAGLHAIANGHRAPDTSLGIPVIEPAYDYELMGLPFSVPPYGAAVIIRVVDGHRVIATEFKNQKDEVFAWPGKENLFPPEGLGKLKLSNHSPVSVFNVAYEFTIEIQSADRNTSQQRVQLPLFNIPAGMSSPMFYLVSESSDAAFVRLADEAVMDIEGSTVRQTIKLKPRNLTLFDQVSILGPSFHQWHGADKIVPPFDISKKR